MSSEFLLQVFRMSFSSAFLDFFPCKSAHVGPEVFLDGFFLQFESEVVGFEVVDGGNVLVDADGDFVFALGSGRTVW